MKTKLLLFLSVFGFAFLNAQNNGVHYSTDPHEVRFIKNAKINDDLTKQAQLRQGEPWQNFRAQHGIWNVKFNEASAMPHRAFGQPIQGVGSNELETAQNFIEQNLNGFGVNEIDLEFSAINSNAKHSWVNFKQTYEGLDVLWSRLVVKVTPDQKVIMFGADVYTDIEIATLPGLSHSEALAGATAGLENITFESINPELSILPIEQNGDVLFHLVYTGEIHTLDQFEMPAHYFTIVDANSGEVLYRQNKVRSCGPGCSHDSEEELVVVNAHVTGTGFLEDPSNPSETLNMPNVEISINGTTFNADPMGNLFTNENGPIDATVTLQGLYSRVVNDISNQTPSLSVTLLEGDNEVSFDADANINEISAYHSVNAIHDYMKTILPSFTGMDFQLTTNVDINQQTCNAFYDGSSINFYVDLADGTCVALSKIADVVYHEYGHGINDNFYDELNSNFQNGGMNEGYADVWAFAPNIDPILGDGLNPQDPDDFVRRYDVEPKVYPEDLVGQVHADGEIIAGAWWDLYEDLGNDMDATMEIFALAYPGLQAATPNGNEGQAYFDVLVDALQADDDDGDLSNGTPNSNAITMAFAEHGITLISNAELTHDDLLFATVDEGILIEASLNIDADFIEFLQAARLYYKINNAADWTVVDMTNVGGDDYEATIPAQPLGTVVQYYLTAVDINGIEASTLPIAANKPTNENIPYFIMVGFEEQASHDSDFNSDWGDWETGLPTDNATTGMWEENVPIGSDNGTVAPDEQNTPGGELCFLTGQSGSPGDAIGANDVDAGTTTLVSPVIDVSGMTNPAFSYYRWYTNSPPSGANPGADWWQGFVSDDGGNTWIELDVTTQSDASWRRYAFRVQDYVDITDEFRMKFHVSDSIRPGQNLDGGSLVEGAMDDIVLWDNATGIGIDETSLDAEVAIYPNPVQDVLVVDLTIDQVEGLNVEILNSLGQIVERRNFGNISGFRKIELNVSDLSSGQYQLRFISGNKTLTRPFNKR